MLAAMAWVCADAVLLVRSGNQRYAVTGLLVYVGGLLFFEKLGGHPVRRVRDHSPVGVRHRNGLTDDGVAPWDSVVGRPHWR